jgi:2-polyprenyl-3-methyl-5-hydroxy-6-metoxy-1,4-benzoquinol methylase
MAQQHETPHIQFPCARLQTQPQGTVAPNIGSWLNGLIDQLPLHSAVWGEHFLDYQQYGIRTPPLIMQLGSGMIVPYPRQQFVGDRLLPGEHFIVRVAHGTILEIGAGWGRVSAALRAMGKSVVTTDASDGAVELYRRRGWDDIATLVLPESIGGPYDTVICLGNVMSLLPGWHEILKAIQSIARGLVGGGLFCLSNCDIPLLDAVRYWASSTDAEPLAFRKRFIYQGRRGPWEHVTPTSLYGLGLILHEVGFKVQSVFFANYEAIGRYYVVAQKA